MKLHNFSNQILLNDMKETMPMGSVNNDQSLKYKLYQLQSPVLLRLCLRSGASPWSIHNKINTEIEAGQRRSNSSNQTMTGMSSFKMSLCVLPFQFLFCIYCTL